MKSTSTILFVTFLSVLNVDFGAGHPSYNSSDYDGFLQRIETIIEFPSSTVAIPFFLKVHLVANLRSATEEFKSLCAQFENESNRNTRSFSPVSSLNRTVQYFFNQYKESADKKTNIITLLDQIQSVDPIGLHVYLQNVSKSSSKFIKAIKTFHATMLNRVNLFESMTQTIPRNIREQITSEYKPLNHETINSFIEIASAQFPNIRMYPVAGDIDQFKSHVSNKTNDVQVLYNYEVGSREVGHAICIYFHASSQNVFVYDSLMNNELYPGQREIIRKLYPFFKAIIFQKPKTIGIYTQNNSIYAIMYATTLLLDGDPCKSDFKLNTVCGDENLYMRLHILNMFAYRKLFLMENEHENYSKISKIVSCVIPKSKQ